ncbi:MAG TPA: Zn(II)2Cys6 transcription factor domain-containing protein [Myxococcota bacterium]|nr:Zn(II)2Cys6 transcription factor domain-containing protein [Myxococcota bacterium]
MFRNELPKFLGWLMSPPKISFVLLFVVFVSPFGFSMDGDEIVIKKEKRKQIRLACDPCRKNHKGCDDDDPCQPCKNAGKEEDCVRGVRSRKRKHQPCDQPLASVKADVSEDIKSELEVINISEEEEDEFIELDLKKIYKVFWIKMVEKRYWLRNNNNVYHAISSGEESEESQVALPIELKEEPDNSLPLKAEEIQATMTSSVNPEDMTDTPADVSDGAIGIDREFPWYHPSFEPLTIFDSVWSETDEMH